MYTERLVVAFSLARELHERQTRKGSGVPYLTHLMGVAALVGEYGGDEDQTVAALLHDAVEDQGGRVTLERIRRAFGERVARLVRGCSDAETSPKPPWRDRKEAFLREIAEAPGELRLVVAADKLHNARAIIKDLHEVGPDLWERFNGGREPTLWYCEAVVEALENGWDHPILRALRDTEDELQRLAARAGAPG